MVAETSKTNVCPDLEQRSSCYHRYHLRERRGWQRETETEKFIEFFFFLLCTLQIPFGASYHLNLVRSWWDRKVIPCDKVGEGMDLWANRQMIYRDVKWIKATQLVSGGTRIVNQVVWPQSSTLKINTRLPLWKGVCVREGGIWLLGRQPITSVIVNRGWHWIGT